MKTNTIQDARQRELALNTHASFIVQAPAGSGKTELLIQRFLCLLSQVSQPEEILAITFTRKAAHEMRQRIIQALSIAAEAPHENKLLRQATLQLAKQALQQDSTQGWELLRHPNRLKIQTIDAFCMNITQQMPILSRFGSIANKICEDPTVIYRMAVRNLLNELQPQQACYQACTILLLHLDNHAQRLEKLLVKMLAIRDQWLRPIVHSKNKQDLKRQLESALQAVIKQAQQQVQQNIAAEQAHEILELFKFSLSHLSQAKLNPSWHLLSALPEATIEHQSLWVAIANFLLTQNYQWRKQINIKLGFPAPASATNVNDKRRYKTMKQRMQTLLQSLKSNEPLRLALENLSYAPPAHYNEGQWSVLKALLELLPVVYARLKLTFAQQSVTDYIEISDSALFALENEQAVSDVALYLDSKIQHILLDEFQDTSINQFRLLQQLTATWQADEGRTLFLVGDPMQSIYRFRKAEVSLFLQAKTQGIGPVTLKFLRLATNFRASVGLVSWLNETFAHVFPKQNNPTTGAISYSPACAAPNNHSAVSEPVCYYQFAQKSNEIQKIIQIIKQCQTQDPNQSIAILIKARSQLPEILAALNHANIAFQGVDIKNLSYSSTVQDLWALTRALLHPGDRIAWLSILRAPWCGLSLNDLHAIADIDHEETILQLISQATTLVKLTKEGAQRLQYLTSIINATLQQRLRLPLRLWIENTWQTLGGYDCLQTQQDLSDAQAFFDLLETHEQAGELANVQDFATHLDQLFMPVYPKENINLHIMTIHKAKGLEFDIVILPGLEKKTARTLDSLMMLAEKTQAGGKTDLILAPIKASEEVTDPIYQYLRYENNTKEQYETARLLYVATTRARSQLYLFATLDEAINEETGEITVKNPHPQSLLSYLWPCLNNQPSQINTTVDKKNSAPQLGKVTYRLPSQWFKTQPLTPKQLTSELSPLTPLDLDNQNYFNRQIGIFIHEQLKAIAIQGLAQYGHDKIISQGSKWKTILSQRGIFGKELNRGIILIEKALLNVMNDPKAAWILDPNHCDAQSELALSAKHKDSIKHIIIDRTFIDEENSRWIIDYKTQESLDYDLTAFKIRAKENHLHQLVTYAKVMQLMDTRPIKLGLYYPLIPLWIDCGYYRDND